MRLDTPRCKSPSNLFSIIYIPHSLLSPQCRHAAVSYGHIELIKLLLAAGADINIEDMDGDTPLLVCEDPEVFDYLLQNGADLKKVNHQGWGIFEKVIDDDNESMMKHLLLHGFTDNPELIAQMVNFIGSPEENEEEESDDENEAKTT